MQDAQRKYTLTKLLGRGGMGQVWAAVKHSDGGVEMACAIKVLLPALAMTDEDCERFHGEARLAAQLDHGRIVKVIDTTTVQGSPSLVMERIDGIDLRGLVEAAREDDCPRLGVDVALYIVGEMLTALAYAHGRTVAGESAGVVHSDVTPGNIMISSVGEVKLTDFGIARFVRSSDHTMSRAIGTPRYMAPEQMRGRIYTATDIYALGVVLHELLEGERYLHECASEEFQFRVLSGEVPPLTHDDIPEWVDELRRRMLSLDPQRRPRAEDAYAMIVERASNYAAAGVKLKALYLRCVGAAKSGLTEMIDIRHGGDAGNFFASVFGEGRGATQPASAPAGNDQPTSADTPALSAAGHADAPKLLRRSDGPAASGAEPRTIERTNTGGGGWVGDEEAPVDATVQLPPAWETGELGLAIGAGATGAAGVGGGTVRAAGAREDSPVCGTGSGTDSGTGKAVIRPTSAPVLADERPARRLRLVMMAAAGIGVVFAGLFVASIVLVWTREAPSTAGSTDAPPATVAADSVHLGDEPPSEPSTASPELAAGAGLHTSGPGEASPSPVADGGDESDGAGSPKAALEPVAEAEAQPPEPAPEPDPPVEASKAAPKPAPKPRAKQRRVPVSFLISASGPGGSKAAQIKVGKRRHSTNNGFKTVDLSPGRHAIAWRWGEDGPWYELSTLTVADDLPSESYYTAKLSTGAMDVKTVRKGGP